MSQGNASKTVKATQSGTWTVQPGNTANTTAWKVDGSAVTQPISGTVTANAGTNLNTSLLALESGGNLEAAATSLSILDDWDETDRAKVNPIVGQAGVQGGSGAVSSSTQRVVLATDVGLPAGTSSIGIVSTKTDLTPSSPTSVSVGVASASAVSSNANRRGLILRNTSSSGQRISLGFGATAVLDSGVTLYPQDAFCMEEFDFDTGQVNAISSAASGTLAVQEYST